MPNQLFTLDDFQFLSKYDPSVNYGQISDAEKARFTSIRNRLREFLTRATEPFGQTWKTHVSILNPSGRTTKDYWCCIFPPGADNKFFAPQLATIISPRGIEICFCLGAGEGSISDAQERLRNERLFRRSQATSAGIARSAPSLPRRPRSE